MKRYFIFFPIFIFFLLFFLDKLLTSNFVRSYTENRVEYYLYQKKALIKGLSRSQKENKDKKYLAFLGTSHMGEFSLKSFEKYSNEIIPYNFSAPLAPYSFHLYSLNQILKSRNKLNYIILEIYPESATEIGNGYASKYSYDFNFLYKHKKNLNYQYWERWLRKETFYTSIFPFDISEIYQKIKNPQKRLIYITIREKLETEINKFNGGIPNTFLVTQKTDNLDKESKKYAKNHYYNLELSQSQLYFLNQIINVAKENNIKLIFWSPILYHKLFLEMEKSPFYSKWEKHIQTLVQNNNLVHLKMNDYEKDLKCKRFIDIQHISGGCYPEITDILIKDAIKM